MGLLERPLRHHIKMKVIFSSLLIAACALASPVKEDAWSEVHQGEWVATADEHASLQNAFDEDLDLVQAGWGKPKPPKKKRVSMDLDVEAHGIKGSICFEGDIPSWVPSSIIDRGMKIILQGKVLKKMAEQGMAVKPDKSTELTKTGDCDKQENPRLFSSMARTFLSSAAQNLGSPAATWLGMS